MRGEIDLSVIVVTHNSGDFIGRCLESLRVACAGIAHEVFVVDSASTDGTAELVERQFPEVRLHRSTQNIGFSAGNNVALPLSTGRHVLLLNPDTVVAPEALDALRAHLESHAEVGAVGPLLRLEEGGIQSQCAQNLPRVTNLVSWLFLLDKLELKLRFGGRPSLRGGTPQKTTLDRFQLLSWARDRTCEVEMICGASMMVKQSVIRSVGLLDEASPLYLDDIDYCRRIRDAGWKIHYVREAVVTHLWKGSSSQLRREADFYALTCHSIYLYLRKHEGLAAAVSFALIAAAAASMRVGVAALGMIVPGRARAASRRQLQMSLALARWALRLPKRPPRFGFASETPAPAPSARPAWRTDA